MVKADREFLFLPAQYETDGDYWSSTGGDGDNGYDLYFRNRGRPDMYYDDRSGAYAVRPFQN